MLKKIIVLFAFWAALTSLGASAQNVTISGTVHDAIGPLAGATVMVQGTSVGDVTDNDGRFSLTATPQSVLEISCLGYETVTMTVGNRTVIRIVLKEDALTLSDAVVLGYGIATKKKDLSASVGIVASPEELATHPVTSTEAMLQGQIPGVTIQNNGGSPTSSPSVVIRGQGSKNGDAVLWVVDGIPGAPVNSLSDIESLVVLKDAASAAIYGAQSGAGGVILVTTKKGSSGVSVTYDGLVGFRSAMNLPASLNAKEEIEMRKTSYAHAGASLPAGWDISKNPWVGTTRTDWVDEIFRNAIYHRHNVVVNAGTDKFKNRLSLTSDNNDGILKATYNKKIGINYRGEFQLNKWIKVMEDLNWSQGDSRGADTNSGYSGVILSAIYMPQSASKHFYDGTGFGGTTTEDPAYIAQYGGNFSDIHGDVINPLRMLEADTRFNRSERLFTTTGLEIANIVKGLKFNSRYSYHVNSNFYRNFSPMRPEVGKPELTNTLEYAAYRSAGWMTENTLTYDRTFDKHTVGALLSTTADYYSARGFSASATGFADESKNLQYFDWADSHDKSKDYLVGPDANVAVIGRLAYSYDDRYFLTASWRRDYAGRLPETHNYGDFPAVTGAWKISSEPFFNADGIVNLLKLRASFGRVGNLGSIGYNYKSAILSNKGWNNQSVQYGYETAAGYCGQFYFNGKALNPNLTWETSEQLDLGLDIDLFRERLSMSFDVYNKRTFNLIQEQSSGWPASIGVDAMYVNLGEVVNRGFEVVAGWQDQIGDWSYHVNGNLAFNKNRVTDIGVLTGDGTKGVWTGGGGFRNVPDIYQTAEGMPLNSYYMVKCLGIFQSDAEVKAYTGKNGKMIQPNATAGDLKFEDYDHNGEINSDDRQYFGNAEPDFTYALNAGFIWKNLGFSMMLQGVQGAQAAYMAKYMLLGDVEGNFNRSRDILNAWSPDKASSSIPRLSKNDPNNNFSTASSWYLEDASYLRLKNITVSYDLTKAFRRLAHFNERRSSCMVYFSGENLFTLTRYSGMDPECGGWDGLKYPVSRVLSFGVKLTY